MKRLLIAALAAPALLCGLGGFAKPEKIALKTSAAACDRACLEGLVDQYLAAMAARY